MRSSQRARMREIRERLRRAAAALGVPHGCSFEEAATRLQLELAELDRQVAASSPDLLNLTKREFRVAQLAAAGRRNREIAAELGCAAGTVKVHMMHVFEKLQIRGRGDLAEIVRRAEAKPGENLPPREAK